jgi:hypothetical protein
MVMNGLWSITEMINQITKEQLIRVKILPQLESLSDFMFDYMTDDKSMRPLVRKLDTITEELITILNEDD